MANAPASEIETQQQELLAIVGYWKTLSAPLAAIIALVPLGGFATASLLPPGFEKMLPALTPALVLIILVFLFYCFRGCQEQKIHLWANTLFVIGMFSLGLYSWLMLSYIAEVDEKRIVLGTTLTQEAEHAIDSRDVTNTTPRDLMTYFGYDSEDRIWTGRVFITALLLFSFWSIFAGIAGSFFLYTLKAVVRDRNNRLFGSAPRASTPQST